MNMIAQPKSIMMAILIGIFQITSFVAIYEGGFHLAANFGREYRRSIGFGIMLHFSFGVFVIAAFAVPFSLIACRTRKPTVVLFVCFLAMWSLLILPSIEEYPLRASFLFGLGLVHVLAFGWVASHYGRHVHATESITPAEHVVGGNGG
jgi:hypothetical protein